MWNASFKFAVAACLPTIVVAVHGSRAWSESIRFLVAEFEEPVHGDSYVLPLSDPSAIAHARQLIAAGPSSGAPLVVAQIAKGPNGVNRNFLAPGAPPWSWHVTAFEGFADFTIEILDGWPTYLESDVDGWLANTNGYIGFWTYTVTAELPPGDYDADLDVDANDLQAWRASFGSTADLSADGSGNGIVDAADYVVWRQNLGRSTTLPRRAPAAASVPEPATLHLSLFCTALVCIMRRRPISWHESCRLHEFS
jgi:hypothetical protein